MLDLLNSNRMTPAEMPAQTTRNDSAVYIELQTDTACRLLTGRSSADGKAAIIGLFGFADRLRYMWFAAIDDNPFAIWWLIRVDGAIADANTVIDSQRSYVQDLVSKFNSLIIDADCSETPQRYDLKFACPYAYSAAQLVSEFDGLVPVFKIAAKIGLLSAAEAATRRRDCERALRRLFCSVQGYWDFTVCRDDVRQRTANAVDAMARMGPIPSDVLDGNRWPKLLGRDIGNAPPACAHG